MKSLLYSPLWQDSGLAVVRIIVGLFLVYHGWEVFDPEKINVYMEWDSFKTYSSPTFWVYMGKSSELATGILLTLGLFTRLAAVIIVLTMLYITFVVGGGKIWYEDQYPFLFVLLAMVFFFTGPGKWSIDSSLFNKRDGVNKDQRL
jgi:uncharacterized membrane protein YphA (DoxX/SURF4 family)